MKPYNTIKSLKGANLLDPKNTPLKPNATINERICSSKSTSKHPLQKNIKDSVKIKYYSKKFKS